MLKGPEIFKDCHMRLHILARNLDEAHIRVDGQRRTAKTLYQKLEANIPRNETNS